MPILEKEIDLYPANLLSRSLTDSVDDVVASGCSNKRWWAFYTRSRHEKSLMRRLHQLRVPFYGPLVNRRHRSRSGRVRTSYTPLFPNYVFVWGSEEERVAALGTNCVSQHFAITDTQQLTRELSQIHKLITIGEPITPESSIASGDRIRVRTGPFAGFEGYVIRRQGETRLLVVVEFMQQGASVVLDDCQVDVLDQ